MSCWSWPDQPSQVEAGIARRDERLVGVERHRGVLHRDDGELAQSVLPGREREPGLMDLPRGLVRGEECPGGNDLADAALRGGAAQVPLVRNRTAQVELGRRSGREAGR